MLLELGVVERRKGEKREGEKREDERREDEKIEGVSSPRTGEFYQQV